MIVGVLRRSGDMVARPLVRDPKIVELPWGGYAVVRLCPHCDHRLHSYPAPSGRWMCQRCGRTIA